jgi:bacterioferritin
MQGNAKVLQELNSLLTGELSAADQYFIHSRMYENWGLMSLYERIDHEREEELEHAARLIQRILFLGGTPNVAARTPLNIGSNVPEMMKNDLAYEYSVVKHLRSAIALCEAEHDYETRRILVELLQNTEEDHTHWLEVQLRLIDQMGLQNYLQSVTGKGPGAHGHDQK